MTLRVAHHPLLSDCLRASRLPDVKRRALGSKSQVDDFDALRPIYLSQRTNDYRLQGCVRLLTSTGPTMLRETFPALLDGSSLEVAPAVWERSRLTLDADSDARNTIRGLAGATYKLFAEMIEFGLSRQATDIVTITDARMERVLRRAEWPLRRIEHPRPFGKTQAVAGYLDVSIACLKHVRSAGGLQSPVLWEPAMSAA